MSEDYKKAIDIWRQDPVLFIEQVLGVTTLEPWQRQACEVIKNSDRISIKACHDVGKTWFLARIFLWFFICRPGSKVLTTAPTWAQVEKLLWTEINSAVKNSKYPLGGRCLLTEYKISDDWFAIGLSPRYEITSGEGQGKQSTFQGFHAPDLMIIFDEATGVRPQIWDLAEGNLTSGRTKFITIGNPTARSSRFFDTFHDLTWKNISVNCFVSPNFIANKIFDLQSLKKEYLILKSMSKREILERLESYVMVNPYLLSVKWVMSRALKWGIDHPLFISKCLGEFPLEDENSIIPLSVVELAQNRVAIIDAEKISHNVRYVGFDIARFGSDSTVFTEILDVKETRALQLQFMSNPQVVGEAINFLKAKYSHLKTYIAIDGGAMGGGVIDLLRDAIKEQNIQNWKVFEIQFGAGFDRENYDKGRKGDEEFEEDKNHFINQKAKMFNLLAKDLKERLHLMSINEGTEDIYQEQLPDIQASLNGKGKVYLESKDDYKKRTGKPSPDFADSLALANYARYIRNGIFDYSKLKVTKKKEFSDIKKENSAFKRFKIQDF